MEGIPHPVRLLSQVANPLKVWGWNRTKICKELDNRGFRELSEQYRLYYLAGWEIFFNGFKDSKPMWNILSHGYKVLTLSFQLVQEL